MTTVFVHHRVADYDKWRPIFDEWIESEFSRDIKSYYVWRGIDDSNLAIVASTIASRQTADALFSNPALGEAMARAGVIQPSVQIDFVDEVGTGTR